VQPPSQQFLPDEQTLPQLPQLLLSVFKLKHPEPQQDCPEEQVVVPPHWHKPPTQEPPLQVSPQLPQFLGSVFRSVHPAAQQDGVVADGSSDVQERLPPTEQAPQLAASVFVLEQVPLQQ